MITEKLKNWAEHVAKVVDQAEPMSDELAKGFISMVMNESKILADLEVHPEQLSDDQMYQMAVMRAKAIDLDINAVVLVFLIHYLCKNPVSMVMYLSYIKLSRFNRSVVNMQTLTMLFPMGFLSEDQLHQLWLAQKLTIEERKEIQRINDAPVSDNILYLMPAFKMEI